MSTDLSKVDILHMKTSSAIAVLKKMNIDYRVVRENDLSYIITDDYVPSRANLTVAQGIVTEVTWG